MRVDRHDAGAENCVGIGPRLKAVIDAEFVMTRVEDEDDIVKIHFQGCGDACKNMRIIKFKKFERGEGDLQAYYCEGFQERGSVRASCSLAKNSRGWAFVEAVASIDTQTISSYMRL